MLHVLVGSLAAMLLAVMMLGGWPPLVPPKVRCAVLGHRPLVLRSRRVEIPGHRGTAKHIRVPTDARCKRCRIGLDPSHPEVMGTLHVGGAA